MKRLLALFFIFLVTEKCSLAQESRVRGKVLSLHAQDIAFASVRLSAEAPTAGRQDLGMVSNESGEFTFDKVPNGAYVLQISMVGYKPLERSLQILKDTILQDLYLELEGTLLEEITVTHKKPLVSRLVDRYVLNVGESILSSGRSTFELLKYAPGVMVKGSQISINGNTSTKVMVNGRLLRLSGDQLQNYLATLRSEDIASIEVVPNPGAEYEAEGSGGLLDIKLKKGTKSGWNGTIGLGATTPIWPSYNGNTQLNYGGEKLQAYGSYNYTQREADATFGDRRFADQSTYQTDSETAYKNRAHNVRLGTNYAINDAHTVGLEYNGSFNDAKSQTQSSAVLNDLRNNRFNTISGDFNTDNRNRFNNVSFNYDWKMDTLGTTLIFIGDYTSLSRTSGANFLSRYTDQGNNFLFDSLYRNAIPTDIENYNVSADFAKKIGGRGQLKAGLKYTKTNTVNDVLYEYWDNDGYVKDEERSNTFDYQEEIFAAYGQYGFSLDKFAFQAGLRVEKTRSEGNSVGLSTFNRDYLGLFPSMYVKYDLHQNHSLALRYNRRLERPTFNILNPFEWRTDDYTYVLGNPGLKPQYTNAINLSYQLYKQYDLTFFTSLLDGTFGSLLSDEPSNGLISRYRWQNLDRGYMYGVNIFAPITVTKWWSMTNNALVYRHQLEYAGLRNNRTIFEGKSTQLFNFKNDLTIELSGYYQSRYIIANLVYVPNYSVDFAISKAFFNKKLQVRGLITDIFNNDRMDYNSVTENLQLQAYQKYLTRRFSVNLIYNFSLGKKVNVKKVQSGNTTERNRMN
ncbi:outer membrane beta-barrel family protein [Sphingobacterium paludis]|uniref:Outer membrane receptor protein involved in Fe transport n=1 Tax=Sphingobacterium paludis TaxID=1476465 RepID=A0A4R7D351_9SPHI|nr:outer membrane beta-barrel family protein [Sphingobacterium paludis]TDS14857.1 outer membrane receptor protein involved in Fe transport [Sphingobacterium paludis]